jgi:hypothetical protein
MNTLLPTFALAFACFALGFTLGGVAKKYLDCQPMKVEKR